MRARIEALYAEFGALVHRRCLAVLKDEEAACDAMQEVFLRLLDGKGDLEGVRSPAGYLYKMATNVSLNALKSDRRRMRDVVVPLEEVADEREDGLAASLLLEILSSGFGERTRSIVYYRYVDGLGLDEIAEQVELSRSAVRKHLDKFRTRARGYKERIV